VGRLVAAGEPNQTVNYGFGATTGCGTGPGVLADADADLLAAQRFPVARVRGLAGTKEERRCEPGMTISGQLLSRFGVGTSGSPVTGRSLQSSQGSSVVAR
jgi:hypothetical protein